MALKNTQSIDLQAHMSSPDPRSQSQSPLLTYPFTQHKECRMKSDEKCCTVQYRILISFSAQRAIFTCIHWNAYESDTSLRT